MNTNEDPMNPVTGRNNNVDPRSTFINEYSHDDEVEFDNQEEQEYKKFRKEFYKDRYDEPVNIEAYTKHYNLHPSDVLKEVNIRLRNAWKAGTKNMSEYKALRNAHYKALKEGKKYPVKYIHRLRMPMKSEDDEFEQFLKTQISKYDRNTKRHIVDEQRMIFNDYKGERDKYPEIFTYEEPRPNVIPRDPKIYPYPLRSGGKLNRSKTCARKRKSGKSKSSKSKSRKTQRK